MMIKIVSDIKTARNTTGHTRLPTGRTNFTFVLCRMIMLLVLGHPDFLLEVITIANQKQVSQQLDLIQTEKMCQLDKALLRKGTLEEHV